MPEMVTCLYTQPASLLVLCGRLRIRCSLALCVTYLLHASDYDAVSLRQKHRLHRASDLLLVSKQRATSLAECSSYVQAQPMRRYPQYQSESFYLNLPLPAPLMAIFALQYAWMLCGSFPALTFRVCLFLRTRARYLTSRKLSQGPHSPYLVRLLHGFP
jgi:hypothetical protein